MIRLVTFLSSLLALCLAKYALDFKDPSASLKYSYPELQEYTDAIVSVKVNLDHEYYVGVFEAGLAVGDIPIIDILTISSPSGDDSLYDYLAFQLMSTGDSSEPPMLMIVITSPMSSGELAATTFCLPMGSVDFNNKRITVNKKGPLFTMEIEGIVDEYGDKYFCQNYNIGEPNTGRMDFSTISVGPNMVGCVSELSFPGVNLLPADDCGFPSDLLSGDVTYFEGTCDSEVKNPVVCPTTPPATTTPPTTPYITTTLVTTPAATTSEPGTPSKPPVLPQTTDSEGKITTPVIPLETHPKTQPKPETEPEITTQTPETTVPETEETIATDPKEPETEESTEDNNVVIGNETDNEDEDEDHEYNIVESETEAATGSENKSSSVVIIICVVSAGIVVIVVLLYVGYRFHFRDKGSYKLEEAKGEPNGDDFANNEYAELNPTTKDQEWYL